MSAADRGEAFGKAVALVSAMLSEERELVELAYADLAADPRQAIAGLAALSVGLARGGAVALQREPLEFMQWVAPGLLKSIEDMPPPEAPPDPDDA